MPYDPQKHHRRSIRLQGYDYSQAGAYFITFCTHQRECLFGEIVNGQMQLNQFGVIVAEEWLRSPTIRQEIELDAWVIMPNHFHGIVVITQNIVGANGNSPLTNGNSPLTKVSAQRMKPRSLSSLVVGFKAAVTKKINTIRHLNDVPIWQRNYYEHIIRDENSLQKLRQYITDNPLSWEMDQLHPNNPSKW
jgi:putative transposase